MSRCLSVKVKLKIIYISFIDKAILALKRRIKVVIYT